MISKAILFDQEFLQKIENYCKQKEKDFNELISDSLNKYLEEQDNTEKK